MTRKGTTRLKHNGSWVYPQQIWIKDSDDWREVQEAFVKDNDEWVRIFPLPVALPSISPTNVSFSMYTRETSTKNIVISNTGDDALTITGATVSSTTRYQTSVKINSYPLVIPAGQTASIELEFVSTGETTGNESVTINFNTFSQYLGDSTFNFVATGRILERYSRASVSPSSISRGGYISDGDFESSISISNTGNGILTISSVTAGITSIISYPQSVNPGATGTIRVRTPNSGDAGSYGDNIYISTNDASNTTISVPVYISISAPSGNQNYTSPGTYSFRVPAGVRSITITAVGGGGGGGGSTEVGRGGGGGGGAAGGYTTVSRSVTPGESLSITVGAGGAGSPYVGRERGAGGGGGTAQGGTTSQISGSFGSVIAAGGPGGNSGTSGSGGAGGQGGGGSGSSGESGTRDNSSTAGGAGGSNGSGYGSGGAGASAPDRVSPFNWAGNPGSSGAVLLSW